MNDISLLKRIKSNDPEAFLDLTDQYGWALYSVIRQKYSDPVVVDKVYNEVMNSFYLDLSRSHADDLVEALLCVYADRISPDNLNYEVSFQVHDNQLPSIKLCSREFANTGYETKQKNGCRKFVITLFVLVICLAFIWLIAGVLMVMAVLPVYDLGYTWLFSQIMDLIG